MDANTARELAAPVPQPTPSVEPQQSPHQAPSRVPVSKFEILLTSVCIAILGWMVVSLVTTKINLTNQQQTLQTVQKKVASVNSSNTSIHQEIAEITSQSNLKKVAKKYGLTDANTSVRNVNK